MDSRSNGLQDNRAEPNTSSTDDASLSKSTRSPSSSPAGTPAPPASPVHKRISSIGLFSRFTFLRATEQNSEDLSRVGVAPRSKTSIDDEDGSEVRSGIPTDADRQYAIKQRKRTVSLRKSALLGVRRLGSDSRERKNSLLHRSPTTQELDPDVSQCAQVDTSAIETSATGLGISKYEEQSPSDIAANVAESQQQSGSPQYELLATGDVRLTEVQPASGTLTNLLDSKNPTAYTSTTEEDDDVLSFHRSVKAVMPGGGASLPPSDGTSISYFPPQVSQVRATARRLRPSPLQNAYPPAPEPYSYIETEYWGWVILFVTWLLFTVGMGSCLDIWSWAWDIGETPYAPPELEDDPTLPIVGYYPALIVLTGVVAWVWITIAWVGMKFFRHS